MENNKWIRIGISGCTNAGKTTLSNYLLRHFPGSILVGQDTFFRKDDDPNHVFVPELNHNNYDCLESVNWDAMLDHLNEIISTEPPTKPSLLIVDGHMILNHPEMRNFFDRAYFMTLNKEECEKRRLTRTYDPPDVPGYFEKVVWPMYEESFKDVKNNCSNIIYLDGSKSLDCIHKTVLTDIENYLKSLRSD